MAEEIIYYRQIGRPLKVVTSPVLRKIRKEQRIKSRNVFTKPDMRIYWMDCLKNDTQSNNSKNVKTLLQRAIDFVGENADCIDSLIGIPEIIGEKIFERFLHSNFKNELIPSCDTLNIFSSVYGEKLLSSLHLSNNLLAINEFLDLFQLLLHNLRELDLSKCLLGDNHEIIEQMRELNSLECLNISENALTDTTLRRMTIAYPKSPVNLKNLNISCNRRISNDGIEKLVCFRKLETLNVTGLDLDVERVARKLNMEISHTERNFLIETCGWCRPLIQGLVKAINMDADDLSSDHDSSITRFYGKRRKICLNLFNDEKTPRETLILVRKNVNSLVKPHKRKSSEPTMRSKRRKSLDDLDLLSIYK